MCALFKFPSPHMSRQPIDPNNLLGAVARCRRCIEPITHCACPGGPPPPCGKCGIWSCAECFQAGSVQWRARRRETTMQTSFAGYQTRHEIPDPK
jgi:hypothetical protein